MMISTMNLCKMPWAFGVARTSIANHLMEDYVVKKEKRFLSVQGTKTFSIIAGLVLYLLLIQFQSSSAADKIIDFTESTWTVSGVKYYSDDTLEHQVEYTFGPETNPYFIVPENSGNELKITNNQIDGNWGIGFIGPDNVEYFTEAQYYTSIISIDVYMNTGDIIYGEASFGTEDEPEYADFASIEIKGDTTSCPWTMDIQDAFDLDPDGYGLRGYTQTPDTYWEWEATESRWYSISFNVYGDDRFDSWAGFHNVSIRSVPEPATILLLFSGLVGLAGFRRRF